MLAPAPLSEAVTRFRLQQFTPALRRAGIEAHIRPFLTTEELRLLYSGTWSRDMLRAAKRAITRRLLDITQAKRFDAVVVQREAALVGPPIIEWALTALVRRPLVFDFDDAVWLTYTSPTYGRWLPRLVKMPSKVKFTLRAATQVIAGSNHLAAFAQQHNANVTVIPTTVDTDQFVPCRSKNETPILGWIGSHSTGPYLRSVMPALARVAQTHKFKLRVIGAKIDAPGVPVEHVPWSPEGEVANLQSFDIGLYPMPDDAWARGKAGLKAIQYMACGVPVVASPVGATNQIVRHGHNGLLAGSEAQWVQAITRLLDDDGLRTTMGNVGREDAVTNWSLRKFESVFVNVMKLAML